MITIFIYCFIRRATRYWRPEQFQHHKDTFPIISFGNGMFGKDSVKFNGHRIGVTGALWRQLKSRQKSGDLLLAIVDKFRNSEVISQTVFILRLH